MAFESYADKLVDGDANVSSDVFVTTNPTYSPTGQYRALSSLSDINGNGTPELAALRILAIGQPQVVFKDRRSLQGINTFAFPVEVGTPIGLIGVDKSAPLAGVVAGDT